MRHTISADSNSDKCWLIKLARRTYYKNQNSYSSSNQLELRKLG